MSGLKARQQARKRNRGKSVVCPYFWIELQSAATFAAVGVVELRARGLEQRFVDDDVWICARIKQTRRLLKVQILERAKRASRVFSPLASD